MKYGSWKASIVICIFLIANFVFQMNRTDAAPLTWFVLIPILAFLGYAMYQSREEKEVRQEQPEKDANDNAHALWGENSVLAPLRGHPAMYGVAALGAGLFVAGTLVVNSIPIQIAIGMCIMGLGLATYGIMLAAQPRIKTETHEPVASSNTFGQSTYGESRKNRILVSVLVLVLLSGGIALFATFELGSRIDSATSGFVGSQTEFEHVHLGEQEGEFSLSGTLSQEGSESFPMPANAQHWNITVTWPQFVTDTSEMRVVIEEKINGAWFKIIDEIEQHTFQDSFQVQGTEVRMSMQVDGPQERNVSYRAQFGAFADSKCLEKHDLESCLA